MGRSSGRVVCGFGLLRSRGGQAGWEPYGTVFMDRDPNQESGGQGASRCYPAPKGASLGVEDEDSGFRVVRCSGGCLQRRVCCSYGNLVGGSQMGEDLLATLAIGDMRFQRGHLLRGERAIVI